MLEELYLGLFDVRLALYLFQTAWNLDAQNHSLLLNFPMRVWHIGDHDQLDTANLSRTLKATNANLDLHFVKLVEVNLSRNQCWPLGCSYSAAIHEYCSWSQDYPSWMHFGDKVLSCLSSSSTCEWSKM